MNTYRFTRKVKMIEVGCVTAESEDEARALIEENDVDDILDFYGTDDTKEILSIEIIEGKEDE